MSKQTHKHVNYCPMSKVDPTGQPRVKSCTGKSFYECDADQPCDITSTDFVCSNFECQIVAKLDKVTLELEEARGNIIKLKAINTEFRLIMFMPDAITTERQIQQNKIDFSGIKGIISNHRKSWDSCDESTIIYMLEFTQKVSEALREYLHERNSKINLKKVVEEKGKIETANAKKKIEQDKQTEAAKRAKLTPYAKALKGYTDIGMKEDAAKAILATMGLKP